MGGQIRRGWIWRFWGAPIFRPEVPKPFKNRYLGTSGLKIRAPQRRQILPRRIWPPICGPLRVLLRGYLSVAGKWRFPATLSCRFQAPTSCDPSIPPEEFLGPSGQKLETELNMSSRGLLAPGSKKLKRESKKWKFSTLFQLFRLFFDSVLTFWTPGPEGPGNSFSTPFPTLGPKGPRTPLGGLKGRNPRLGPADN